MVTEYYQWQCEYCGKQFNRKHNLRRHILIHSKTRSERPKRFECMNCTKFLASKQSLKQNKPNQIVKFN